MPASASPSAQEQSYLERRGALRHPVAASGLLSHEGAGTVTVSITDISEQGCQITRSVDLARGAAITLAVSDFVPFAGTVVWTSPTAYGIHFDHRLHPALVERIVAIGQGRRRSRRLLTGGLVHREDRDKKWHLRLEAWIEPLAAGQRPVRGELSDLSLEGCRITCATPLVADTPVTLALPGHPPIEASVRWCDKGAIGFEFAAPLPLATVERIARFRA